MHVALVHSSEEFIFKTQTGQKVMSFGNKQDALDWNDMRHVHADLTGKTIAQLTLVKVTRLEEVL